MKQRIAPIAIIPLILFSFSCWDKDFISDQGIESGRRPWTPSKFIRLLEEAYRDRDVNANALLLDDAYTFYFLPDDPADPDSRESWGPEEELASLGNIFSFKENPEGAVLLIKELGIAMVDTAAYTFELPRGEGEEIRYSVTARLDFAGRIYNPQLDGDARHIDIVVSSTQEFTLRPHPDNEMHLLLVEQYDGEPAKETASKDSVEYLSWGEVKSRFRYERTPGLWGLLEDHFPEVYAGRDSFYYAGILDPNYEFVNLPSDPDDPLNVEKWDRATELVIAGRMFTGWTNSNGVRVESIEMAQAVETLGSTTDDYPDRPPGEEWYDVGCGVHLVVITSDPTASDGSGIINRELLSYQYYVVRPDPHGLNTYVIRKQIDGEPIPLKNGRDGATEATNWGAVKGLFR